MERSSRIGPASANSFKRRSWRTEEGEEEERECEREWRQVASSGRCRGWLDNVRQPSNAATLLDGHARLREKSERHTVRCAQQGEDRVRDWQVGATCKVQIWLNFINLWWIRILIWILKIGLLQWACLRACMGALPGVLMLFVCLLACWECVLQGAKEIRRGGRWLAAWKIKREKIIGRWLGTRWRSGIRELSSID